jgi:hypothetical protein
MDSNTFQQAYSFRMDDIIENSKKEDISSHGGARAGAGRKPRLQFEARELFNRAVDERWNEILQQIDVGIAKGDKDIIRMCVEQRIGRAAQSLSVKNEDSSRPAATLFFNPRIRVAMQVLENDLKREISQALTAG